MQAECCLEFWGSLLGGVDSAEGWAFYPLPPVSWDTHGLSISSYLEQLGDLQEGNVSLDKSKDITRLGPFERGVYISDVNCISIAFTLE